ncbi:CYTH domain-containing protein [Streptococcus catagoni]|uniref:CYTH domain-containing protein n=1 Tax=Streptococcus catagoni TaxID=2654874 RepID=UPI00140E3E56|nr:CYTH domain-containing protein [Streptococcus catagoni]
MSHLEIEYKTLLTKDEYQRLLAQMTHINAVTQTNYYIDTANFDLKANRMSLRIRTFSDKAEMTLKVPEEVGNREYNQDLSLQEAKNLIKKCQITNKDILLQMTKFGISPEDLRTFGQLTTRRKEKATAIGTMALDYNQYAQTIDYELELEVNDPIQGEKDFEQFLKDNNISLKFAKSKVSRFAKTLKNSK